LLYGWTTVNGTVNWLLKDSWPANDPNETCAHMSTSVTNYAVDFIAGINSGNIQIHASYILAPTITSGSITQQAIYTTAASQPTLVPLPVPATQNILSLNIPILNHYLSGSAPVTASINNISQLDPGYTVAWSWQPAHNGATANIAFGTPNSPTTTLLAGI